MELPPVDELVERINRQLGKVETVEHLGDKYKGVLIVKVVECDKLEQSDHLYRCLIDDSGANKNVERNEQGLVQVLTGAKNVYAGMIAVWLPPNSTVPESFDKEPFVLTSRKMLGVISYGMLASYKELAIGDEHAGILEITVGDMLPQAPNQDRTLAQLVGQSFAETFGLDDTVIDVENKMFTHRPDLFGQLGIAREISAIIRGVPDSGESDEDTRFVNPEWYWKLPKFDSKKGLVLDTFNDIPDDVSRLIFTAVKNVEVQPSPLWLRCALVAMGAKSINNIVDVTNYIMLVTAQPVHAYDYDKLRGHKIGARMAKYGEKVALLNGKTYELTSDDIVIADGEGPVGLGGIMGGNDSEVDEDTKNIVCEVATFNMYTARKSSMRHGLFTDALTRFNKGQSPLQNSRIMSKLLETLWTITPGEQASDVLDVHNDVPKLDETTLSGEIEVSSEFINARLGLTLTTDQIGGLLRRVNFASYPGSKGDDTPVFVAPFWRTDIEQPEDIVEEVGRLYGFEKLPRELPKRSIRPVSNNPMVAVRQLVRESLARFGANEILTYSFV
ncbi:MAG: phenylalanine--tRNA ligase subunit beta, partial [Candidatus Saccharimonas sp.]